MKVEYVDHMGTDLSVVNAARVSFRKKSSFDTVETGHLHEIPSLTKEREYDVIFLPVRVKVLKDKDVRLIKYLAEHDHWTPFAHTAITLRVSAPVPIRTQCFKHKQGLVENEESRRYITYTPELYIPDTFRSKPEGNIKQGSGEDHPRSDLWREKYIEECRSSIKLYEDMIADGICPEQARFALPQGVEVNWIWTGNLYAFANFYNKRSDPHAQKEIQDLAKEVDKVIKPLFPVSWRALTWRSKE